MFGLAPPVTSRCWGCEFFIPHVSPLNPHVSPIGPPKNRRYISVSQERKKNLDTPLI